MPTGGCAHRLDPLGKKKRRKNKHPKKFHTILLRAEEEKITWLLLLGETAIYLGKGFLKKKERAYN